MSSTISSCYETLTLFSCRDKCLLGLGTGGGVRSMTNMITFHSVCYCLMSKHVQHIGTNCHSLKGVKSDWGSRLGWWRWKGVGWGGNTGSVNGRPGTGSLAQCDFQNSEIKNEVTS